MKTTRIVILLILLLITATASVVVVFLKSSQEKIALPNNEVVENTEIVNEKSNLIKVSNPRPNQVIASPFIVQGEARGTWYFEADFPVSLYDESDNLLVQTHAQAKSDWMTEDFVPFSAELIFEKPKTTKGTLVLEKSNPSGLPQNSDELRIPVLFR